MNKTTHTPGPWMVAEYGIAELRAKYLCVKKGGRTICRIDAQGNSTKTNGTDEANARLIAAAPALLAALKELARKIERDNVSGRYHITPAKTAIEDAERI